MRSDREALTKLGSDMRGKDEAIDISTSEEMLSIAERPLHGCISGNGIHGSSEKPGSYHRKSRSVLMHQQEGNALPIRSHPQPEEPLVHHPFFHDLDPSDFFKFHKVHTRKSWELVRELLPLARNFSVIDAFEVPWAQKPLESLLHRKAPQPQRCHPAMHSEGHYIKRICLHHQRAARRNQVAPVSLIRRGSVHDASMPKSHESPITQCGTTRMSVSGCIMQVARAKI